MFKKYPRTPHIVGSKHQHGDDLEDISFKNLQGKHLVIEEKIDGSNVGISFYKGGLQLQSRGHILRGGPRERQFDHLKAWASTKQNVLYDLIGEKYIMYGEYAFCKHTEFYDRLPHYFMEFDILDKETGAFLSTPIRHKMLEGSGVVSVPVLSSGKFESLDQITAYIGPSLYKSDDWLNSLRNQCDESNQNHTTVFRGTDLSELSEGLYIKAEAEDKVVGRYKFIRQDFINAILDSGTHWQDRPIIPNMLAPGVDIFA